MRNLKRILALLTALALLLTAAAVSEEQIAPAEPEQPAAQEQIVAEEPAAEPVEEPAEQLIEEPAEEIVEGEPAEESAEAPAEEQELPEQPEPEAAPEEERLPAERLAEELGLTLEQLAEELGLTAEELSLLDEAALRELCAQMQESSVEMEAINAGSDFEIDESGVLMKYNGPGGDVRVPDGVKGIGDEAFGYCYGLVSVTLPEGLTSIGERAFFDCQDMTGISLPGSLTSIGASAFEYCGALAHIAIPAGVKSIGNNAFSFAALADIEIPGDGVGIGKGAFSDCEALSAVKIPGDNVTIGEGAFSGSGALTRVEITGNGVAIGKEAFFSCDGLSSLTIPGGNISLGASAFRDCFNLKRVRLTGSIAGMGERVFASCSNLRTVELPEGLAELPAGAFEWCYSLQSFAFPSTVAVIGESAFAYTNLLTVRIPGTVKRIGDGAFRGCGLDAVALEEGVMSIGGRVFDECGGIETITLPASLAEIDRYAFAGCSAVLIVKSGSYAEKFCVDYDIPHQSNGTLSEISFIGVRNGDAVPLSGYQLRWKAVSGATNYDLRMACGDDIEYINGDSNCKYKISFYEYGWTEPDQEVSIHIVARKWNKKAQSSTYLAEGNITLRPRDIVVPDKVAVSPAKVSLGVGQTQRLSCTLTPVDAEPSLTFSSSKPKIASVSEDGVITALAKGSATITIETLNGKKARCRVTISKAPTKVSLNKPALTLAEQQTAKLKATLSGGKGGLSWESSNPDVAAVDQEGNITAAGAGEATISVRAHNYEPSKPKLLASCALTVKPAPRTLALPAVLTLGKGEKLTLAPEIDEGSMCSFTFSTSDKKIVSVDAKGKLTAKKIGQANITVKTHNGLERQCAVAVAAAPKNLALSERKLALAVGESQSVAAILPAGAASHKLTPSSSKKGIATVEPLPGEPGRFIIKGVSKGKATIAIKTFNGKKASVDVTVN